MIDEPCRTLKIWQQNTRKSQSLSLKILGDEQGMATSLFLSFLFFSFPFFSFLSLSFLSFLFSFSLLLYFAFYTTYDTTLYFTLHHQHHIFCAYVALEPPQEANTVRVR